MTIRIAPPAGDLKKALDWKDLVFLGVGSTIGAGIFTVTGLVAATKTGPALFLSYIVSGFACLLSALSYAEFAAMSPTAGSAYAYARGTGGELLGWIIGFDLTLEYSVAAATVAQGWSKTFVELLSSMGAKFPHAISNPPWQFDSETGEASSTGAAFDLIAMLITGVTSAVLMRGIQESARFNNAMVCLKVAIILFVIVVGVGYIDSSNYSPFAPHGLFGISFFGHSVSGKSDAAGNSVGVLAGSAYVFFSYIGFDAVTTNAEECVNPQRDLPIGILGSLGLSTLLYVAVSVVLTGMVPYNLIDRDNPFTKAFKMVGLDWAEFIIGLGALAGLGSVLLVTLLGQPRILLAMSRDGLLPNKVFNEIHPVYQTPFKSQALTGILVSFLAGFIPEQLLVELVSIGTLFAFMVVNLAVVWLRYAKPELHRPFKCPWMPAIPIGGALICLLLMLSLPSTNWIRLVVWLAIGLVIYFSWGRPNAARLLKLQRENLNDSEQTNHGKEYSSGQSNKGTEMVKIEQNQNSSAEPPHNEIPESQHYRGNESPESPMPQQPQPHPRSHSQPTRLTPSPTVSRFDNPSNPFNDDAMDSADEIHDNFNEPQIKQPFSIIVSSEDNGDVTDDPLANRSPTPINSSSPTPSLIMNPVIHSELPTIME